MPVNIETLYINLNFNIPGSINRYLTRNMFYFPSPDQKKVGGALSKYPFFTFDVKYPVDELKNLTRENLISVFFDKEQFSRLVSGKPISLSPSERFDNGNYNIMCMLGCMFPTVFPVQSNIQNSFESKIEKKVNINDEFDFSNDGTIFSYIQLGGVIYTVTKSIWINDIINNTTFQKLLTELNKYNDWETKQKNELVKQIELQKKKMMESVKIIKKEYIDRTLVEIDNFLKKGQNGYRSRDILENIKATNAMPLLKDEFSNFFSNQTDVNKLVTITIKIKKLLDKMYSYADLIPREFLAVVKYAKTINSDNTILYVIEHPEFIKKVGKETKEVLSKYKNIGQIVSILAEFSSPKLNTSNPEIQKLIDDFIKNKDSVARNIKGFASHVKNTYMMKTKTFASPYSTDLLNAGVSLSKLPFMKNGKLIKLQNRRLEIQVQIDAFKGIITNDKIKCIHRNAVLEKLYESLKTNESKETVELDKLRPYLDFESIKPIVKQGGKSRKQKKVKRNITRKTRF
jgi:hypothetical protein